MNYNDTSLFCDDSDSELSDAISMPSSPEAPLLRRSNRPPNAIKRYGSEPVINPRTSDTPAPPQDDDQTHDEQDVLDAAPEPIEAKSKSVFSRFPNLGVKRETVALSTSEEVEAVEHREEVMEVADQDARTDFTSESTTAIAVGVEHSPEQLADPATLPPNGTESIASTELSMDGANAPSDLITSIEPPAPKKRRLNSQPGVQQHNVFLETIQSGRRSVRRPIKFGFDTAPDAEAKWGNREGKVAKTPTAKVRTSEPKPDREPRGERRKTQQQRPESEAETETPRSLILRLKTPALASRSPAPSAVASTYVSPPRVDGDQHADVESSTIDALDLAHSGDGKLAISIGNAPGRLPDPTHVNIQSSAGPPSPPLTPEDPLLAARSLELHAAKIEVARRMMFRLPIDQKPAPLGRPPVWADDRQALCETFTNFQSYNGGAYCNDGHAYGFMIDGHSGDCREYIDEDLVIARMSGGMGQEEDAKGPMAQVKDQNMDHAVAKSLLNNIAYQDPVLMIFGNRSAGLKVKMPKKYNVAGYYKPISVWSEKTKGRSTAANRSGIYTTVKYRLERLDGHEPAWFAAPLDTPLLGEDVVSPMYVETCQACEEKHPRVYLFGWCCLNSQCTKFWKLYDGRDAPCGAGELYDPSFLRHRTRWDIEQPPQELLPPLPAAGLRLGDHLGREHNRGIVCRGCGKCLPRWKWAQWVCNEPDCGWEHKPDRIPIPLSSIVPSQDLAMTGPPTARHNHFRKEMVSMQTVHRPGAFKGHIYSFAGIGGCLAYLMPYASVRAEDRGFDQMFEAMQTEDCSLERRPIRKAALPKQELVQPKKRKRQSMDEEDFEADELPTVTQEPTEKASKQGSFMNAFSMNYGEPYKFIASPSSAPFEAAPWPVQQFRSVANYMAGEFLPSEPEDKLDFNELLIFAYTSGQKINYHDDGEAGLGPRIATLSLGGRARMNLRMKSKYYTGVTKTGLFVDEPPIRGCFNEATTFEPRMKAWQELQLLKSNGDLESYNQRRAELPKELGLRSKNAPPLLELGLSHGTVIIMDGYAVQKYFEHEVEPEDTLRFALTCRHIKNEHLAPHERPPYVVGPDPIQYAGPIAQVARQEELARIQEENEARLSEKVAAAALEARLAHDASIGSKTDAHATGRADGSEIDSTAASSARMPETDGTVATASATPSSAQVVEGDGEVAVQELYQQAAGAGSSQTDGSTTTSASITSPPTVQDIEVEMAELEDQATAGAQEEKNAPTVALTSTTTAHPAAQDGDEAPAGDIRGEDEGAVG